MSGAELLEVSDEGMASFEGPCAIVLDGLEVSVGEPHDDVLCRCGSDVVVGGVVATRLWVPLDDEDAHLVRVGCQVELGTRWAPDRCGCALGR